LLLLLFASPNASGLIQEKSRERKLAAIEINSKGIARASNAHPRYHTFPRLPSSVLLAEVETAATLARQNTHE
jgi:hypothetical protein